MTYEFNFDKMTIGDMQRFASGDCTILDAINLAEKIVAGGVKHLPLVELNNVFTQLAPAFAGWIRAQPINADSIAWEEMLRDIKGL